MLWLRPQLPNTPHTSMRRNRMCTFTSACVCIMTLMTHVGCSFTNNLPHSSDRLYLALSCLLPVFRRGNSLFFSASMSHHVDLRSNVLRDQGWKLLQEFLVCKHIVNDWKLKRNVFNCSLTCFAVFFASIPAFAALKVKDLNVGSRYHTYSRFQSSNSRSMICGDSNPTHLVPDSFDNDDLEKL